MQGDRPIGTVMLGLAGAIGTMLVMASLGAGAETSKRPEYRGDLQFDGGRVEFRIRTENGEPSGVRFVARNVKIYCDTGEFQRSNFQPILLRFTNAKATRFRGEDVFNSGTVPDFALYQVRGRLLSGGRAKGHIFSMYDPWDPPELPNMSECGTYRRIKWTAERGG